MSCFTFIFEKFFFHKSKLSYFILFIIKESTNQTLIYKYRGVKNES